MWYLFNIIRIKTGVLYHIKAYQGDHAAGPDTVIHACHAQVVRVLSPPHEVLVSHVVRTVVDHEHAALHPDGAAAVKHGVQVSTVTHALIVTASKVFVLIEDYLMEENKAACHIQLIHTGLLQWVTESLYLKLDTNLSHYGSCCWSDA